MGCRPLSTCRSICLAIGVLIHLALAGCASTPPEPPVHRALLAGNLAELRQQAQVKGALEERYRRGMTPLQAAIFLGRREFALELIGLGADVNAITPDGSTPLTLAVDKGDADLIDRLLAAGVRIDPRTEGAGPLFSALRTERMDLFERFLQAGANVERRNGLGETPLHVAAARGQAPFAERLLRAGAAIDAALPDGRTALHGALLGRRQAMADMLYARGAAATPATGEVGSFSTALVYRFASEREAMAQDRHKASMLAVRAQAAFETLEKDLQARASELSSEVTKTQALNLLSILVGAAGAAQQARTSLSGTGYGHYSIRGTGGIESSRDQYAGLARWSGEQVARMRAVQACLASAGEPRTCFAEPKEN
jgi:ankyrin repeat protein